MNRLNLFHNQICNENNNNNKIKNKSECVIISAIRSPMTKAKKGELSKIPTEIILSQLMNYLIKKTKINPSLIDDIIIGNVLQGGCGFINSRVAQKLSGIPENVPLYTINRLCNSGLQAIINANEIIKNSGNKIIIAGGIEKMSNDEFKNMLNKNLIDKNIFDKEKKIIENIFIPMGNTNENICKKFNISREEQDIFAYNSHIKAISAEKKLLFSNEILPIKYNNIIVSKDDIRNNIDLDKLKKLPPVFEKNGTTTAGNSSPLTDGCALVLMTTREIAEKFNCEILGKITDYSVVGVPSEIMGIGPAIAIPKVLKSSGLNLNEIDLFEINEAFAGQALYCIKTLGIPENKVNVHGGAIALGHPLGCTGGRLVVSLLNELKIYNKKRGIVSMCVGTGMGAACIIERDD